MVFVRCALLISLLPLFTAGAATAQIPPPPPAIIIAPVPRAFTEEELKAQKAQEDAEAVQARPLPPIDTGPSPLARDYPADEDFNIWRGSMELTPCSTVETNNDGWGGLPSITARIRPQIFTATIKIHIHTNAALINRIRDDVRDCAAVSAGAATISAISTSGTSALPAFRTAFLSCAGGKNIAAYLGEMTLEVGSECT